MPDFHDKSVTALAPLTPNIAGAHRRDFEGARMDAPVSGTLLTILPATLQRAAAGPGHCHALDRWPNPHAPVIRNRDLEIDINATRIAGIASRNQDAQLSARLLTAMADAVLHA